MLILDFYEACEQQAKEICNQLYLFVDSIFGKSTFFSGMSTSTYTRQRTTRGLTAKRRKVTDGSSKTAPELHVNTSDLLEMEYECVTGEPPAAAAKLRSGM